MENDIWILDVNIIYHVGCFAVLASSPCSAEAVISRANEWWVQHGFIQIYLSSVLLSAEPGAGHCWFSGQGGWTSAGGHNPWVSLWELSTLCWLLPIPIQKDQDQKQNETGEAAKLEFSVMAVMSKGLNGFC